MDVAPAETDWELEQVRRLFRSFVAWHREWSSEELELIDAYFGGAAYEQEIATLPGPYAPPDGALLVCWEAELALGCGAFRRLDERACELRRLFVPQMARGRGVGRTLATELVEHARAAGYSQMYVDASIGQTEAVALYRDVGFEQIEAYDDVPEPIRDWLLLFRLEL
jgi:GNAT superfamily N-acetyltransferase